MNAVPLRLDYDWFPAPLPPGVAMGDRSWCYSSFAWVHSRSERSCCVRMGHDTGVYHGSFFDLGPMGQVEIGNFCTLVGAIIVTNGKVTIGDYSFLAHEVVLSDDSVSEPSRARAGTDRQALQEDEPRIVIGANCWVGARAVLLSGARLGEGVIVGAGAVVGFDVPPHSVVAGNPARIVGSSRSLPAARPGDSSQPIPQ